MDFKLDENLGVRTQQLLRVAGHEAQTVRDQGMQGCSEDLDFADVTRFPPTEASGIVVIRLPRNAGFELLEELVRYFLKALAQMSVENELWIVEPGRIRIHQSERE